MHRPSKRNQRASWHIPLDEEDLPAEEAGGDNRTDRAHKQWGSGVNRLDGSSEAQTNLISRGSKHRVFLCTILAIRTKHKI